MALTDELQRQGSWLFRWRSYLPLLLMALVPLALKQFTFPFGSSIAHEFWEELCLGISLLGLFVRALVIGYAPRRTSGRNTKRQIAEKLNTTGPYSIVRHPLYLGNFLIGLGITLVAWVWWLPVIYTLLFCIYYERIMMAEEAFLHETFGSSFDEWAKDTPAFWPRFTHWRRPELTFSFRNVLRREYAGLAVVILGHSGMEFAEHELLKGYAWQTFWTVLTIGGLVVYVLLSALKNRTTLLDVAGR
jgi:protein-S-isoprenylcysteine O-methyltransferase Ste14